MPHVMIIIKIQETALFVTFPRPCWRLLPRREITQEESEREYPTHKSHTKHNRREKQKLFLVSPLHYDIKCQIENSIDDQDGQQVGSKVTGCSSNTIDGTASGTHFSYWFSCSTSIVVLQRVMFSHLSRAFFSEIQ